MPIIVAILAVGLVWAIGSIVVGLILHPVHTGIWIALKLLAIAAVVGVLVGLQQCITGRPGAGIPWLVLGVGASIIRGIIQRRTR